MKTVLSTLICGLLFTTVMVASAKAQQTKWTTADFDLKCHGEIKAVSFEDLKQITKTYQTRVGPKTQIYTQASVEYQFLSVSEGCAKAQAQFALPFAVSVGTTIHGKISAYGLVNEKGMAGIANIGQAITFAFEQKFYGVTAAGDLPLYPLLHTESVTLVTEAGNDFPGGVKLGGKQTSDEFANYKYLDSAQAYGLVDIKKLSKSEHLQYAKNILELAYDYNLQDAELFKIIFDGVSVASPEFAEGFNSENPDDQIFLKKYFDLVIPFIDQFSIKYQNFETAPKEIKSIYSALLGKINYNLIFPFSNVSADLDYSVSMYIKLPLLLQTHDVVSLDLTADTLEKYLSAVKQIVQAYETQSTLTGEFASYVTLPKVQQLQTTVGFIKNTYNGQTSYQGFPKSEKIDALINEILLNSHL